MTRIGNTSSTANGHSLKCIFWARQLKPPNGQFIVHMLEAGSPSKYVSIYQSIYLYIFIVWFAMRLPPTGHRGTEWLLVWLCHFLLVSIKRKKTHVASQLYYNVLHWTLLRLLHWTLLYCTELHCTVMHYAALHYTALHCHVLMYTALHCTEL